MIPSKARESRRMRANKLSKNLERLYKERKCRDCAVVVTRMDFAKILGKFTKVKIQYESSKTPKTKQNANQTSPNVNARLKTNENGMVLVHRKAYNEHPAKDLAAPKKLKGNPPTPRVASNILKENNRLKKTASKDTNSNYGKKLVDHNSNLKLYSIVFEDPLVKNNNNDFSSKISLADLLPNINESILPSDDWCIDYFPKSDEPKDDKVYDRIAAELEDLMYNEKPVVKPDEKEDKVDDFPSIMDILNDNTTSDSKPNNPSSSQQSNTNLESSDVEAMLLGKTNPSNDTPMEVDNSDIGNIIGDQLGVLCGEQDESKLPTNVPDINNPHSPSILDETLQKGIEEHLPVEKSLEEKDEDKTDVEMPPEQPPSTCEETTPPQTTEAENESKDKTDEDITSKTNDTDQSKSNLLTKASVTHVVFKKLKDGSCYKSVTCPKNLKYGIEFAGKSVEFLGAPKFITSLEDLEVLLQIVHESRLDSLYVLH